MTAHRNTWQKAAVKATLEAAAGFVGAQALHEQLAAVGRGMGLTTVYRILAEAHDRGEADALVAPNGEVLYRACQSGGHHHHLMCRQCGRTVELAADAVEAWAGRVAAEQGFTEVSHTVDIFGRCPQCAKRGNDLA